MRAGLKASHSSLGGADGSPGPRASQNSPVLQAARQGTRASHRQDDGVQCGQHVALSVV